jgi:hypothetical protein
MNITSSDMWEQHVQNINIIELKWIRYGIDSISSSDTNYIHTLAESCPFIEGTAVYTARVLWSYFEPDAFFDDRYLCNAGNNKQENGSNSFFNVDSFIYSQIKQQLNDYTHIGKLERGETKMITVNEQQAIYIYPNPASTFITIAYRNSTDGYFKLFNTLGQVVMETQLSAMNTKVQLLLTDVANGLYHYDISFLDGQQTQGKLLIQKK